MVITIIHKRHRQHIGDKGYNNAGKDINNIKYKK